jgi:NitT/TauT family transport system permease protein
MNGILRKGVFYLLLVSLWAAASSAGLWESYEFPAPGAVLRTLWAGLLDGSFLIGIAVSMKRILIGYGLSVIAGTALGILVGSVKVLDDTLGSLIQGLQALPSICWLPLRSGWPERGRSLIGGDPRGAIAPTRGLASRPCNRAAEHGVGAAPPAGIPRPS